MFSYTVFFGLLAVAAAQQCGCDNQLVGGLNSGYLNNNGLLNGGLLNGGLLNGGLLNSGLLNSGSVLGNGLVGSSAVISQAAPAPANQVVSNNCKCVKTILRPKLQSFVEIQPTETKSLQATVRPIFSSASYTVQVPASVGPQVSGPIVGLDSFASPLNSFGLNSGISGIVGNGLNSFVGSGLNSIVGSGLNSFVGSGLNSIVGSGLNSLGCNGLGLNGLVGGDLSYNNLGLNSVVGGGCNNLVSLNSC